MIGPILDPLLTLFFPRFCRICGGSVESHSFGLACGRCWDATCIFSGRETACTKCGQLLDRRHSDLETRCSRCVEDYYDRAVSAADYHFAAKAVVLTLKDDPLLPARAARLLNSRFDNSGFYSTTIIVPVPLSEKRMRERGFNQAELLARCLEGHTGIRVAKDVLLRTEHFAMHRAGMDKKARTASVRKAFAVRKPKIVREEKILLVDDIFTTGSTASSCAMVLKGAGAAEVNVLTLARAPFYY